MTPAQLATLKAAIVANPVWVAYPNTQDGAYDLAMQQINVLAVPEFIGWKTSVNASDIMLSAGFDWTRVDNLSIGKARIWDWLTKADSSGSLNPSQLNIRAGIDAAWVGTAADLAVRAAIYALCKEPILAGEKVFATGVGTIASPATRVIVGDISYADVYAARNLT